MNQVLKDYFEKTYLPGTGFDSLGDLLKDNTQVDVNARRTLIAHELRGIWQGIKDEKAPDRVNVKYI